MEEERLDQNSTKGKSGNGVKRLIQGFVIGILFSMAVILIAFIGKRLYGIHNVKKAISDVNGGETVSVVNDTVVRKIGLIQGVVDKYFLDEYTNEALEDGIYSGMINALNDKYAAYYSPEELKQLKDDSEGIYYGIGAYITMNTEMGYPAIAGVMDDSPAKEAGLMTGDIIVMVDETATDGMESADVVKLIKGEEGTFTHITVARGENNEIFEFDVERRRVESPTVNQKMLDDNIGYIQVTEFDTVTADQFTEALAVCKGSGARGIIIDLRSNLGGNLDAVVDMCRHILPEGLIVYTCDKHGEREEYTSDGSHELKLPLVVLTNGYSASASEIMTGAIKDYGIGTIVGTTTYGKGIVQKVVSLSDGSAVKLTVSKYYTPKGTCIHGTGIEPDIEVEFDADAYYDKQTDNQLDAAIKEIHRKWEEEN